MASDLGGVGVDGCILIVAVLLLDKAVFVFVDRTADQDGSERDQGSVRAHRFLQAERAPP